MRSVSDVTMITYEVEDSSCHDDEDRDTSSEADDFSPLLGGISGSRCGSTVFGKTVCSLELAGGSKTELLFDSSSSS